MRRRVGRGRLEARMCGQEHTRRAGGQQEENEQAESEDVG